MATEPDIRQLAQLLDDENDEIAVNVIAALLAREAELGDLPAQLQESSDPLVRRRAHQLQAALLFRRRRREFCARLEEEHPDYLRGLTDLHMLWFDRDSLPEISEKLFQLVDEGRKRTLNDLDDAERLMRRLGFTAEPETTLRPENYCIGTIIDQCCGSTALLMGLLREMSGCAEWKIVRTLGEFGLYDGESRLLLGQGQWRAVDAPDTGSMEFWDVRSVLRFAGAMLFSSAVNGDSFRYVLTIAQALTGDEGDEILNFMPYPYGPGK